MAGFRKAKGEQSALKIGVYGPSGSGKTFTSLLVGEGLAKLTKKRMAFVDTEHGTDFYAQAVKERNIHPKAFDFDALYTRSLQDVLKEVQQLDPNEHSVIVIDSITHLWETAINSYSGKTTRAGTIPMYAWGKIKKPYKDLMTFLLNSPFHVFICGRQGNEFGEDDSGELKLVGVKMKAEGETPYEPHILIRMETVKGKKGSHVEAFFEKDRTGIHGGKSIKNPTFDTVAKPLLNLLGETQAQIQESDEAAGGDAEKIFEQDQEKREVSAEYRKRFMAKFDLAETEEELEKVSKELTAKVKKLMLTEDVKDLREKYNQRSQELAGPKKVDLF